MGRDLVGAGRARRRALLTALSLLHGTDAANNYRAAGGTLGGNRYWWLIDAVGFLPDPEKVAAPWRQSGRPDLDAGLARRRLEGHLAWVLDGSSD